MVNNVVDEGDVSAVLNSVKGPELLNMYVGQSEENVREGKIYLFNTRRTKVNLRLDLITSDGHALLPYTCTSLVTS